MQCSAESLHRNKRTTDGIKKKMKKEGSQRSEIIPFPVCRNKTCQILTRRLYLPHAGRENGRVRKPQTCSQPEQEMKETGSHGKYAAAGRRERTFAKGRRTSRGAEVRGGERAQPSRLPDETFPRSLLRNVSQLRAGKKCTDDEGKINGRCGSVAAANRHKKPPPRRRDREEVIKQSEGRRTNSYRCFGSSQLCASPACRGRGRENI